MASFGQKSKDKLSTAHPKLQLVMNEAIKVFDFTVLYGNRSVEEQFELFKKGRELQSDGTWKKVGSTVTNLDGKTKKSNHNYSPSRAVDIAPYPINWEDEKRFKELADIVKQCAKNLNIKIIWGGDWISFKDTPHFELDKSEI